MTTFRCAGDFLRFRSVLHEASRRFSCAIHAYTLMSNHVHVLLTPEDEQGPARLMQAIGPKYVRYVNARYARTGTLWEGRYHSSLVGSDRYFLTCSRYIELNPVRAQMVDVPGEYSWSSYRCNANGEPDSLVTPHASYQALGAFAAERQVAYRALFQDPLDSETIAHIRRATNTNGVFGGESFCAQMEEKVRRPLSRLAHGGDRRSAVFSGSGRHAGRALASFQDL